VLLLDTNIWFNYYWDLPLPKRLLELIEKHELAVSPVSVFEIATKIRRGKLRGIPPLDHWIGDALNGYAVVGLTPGIAAAAGQDRWAHQDPADRLLVHSALANQLVFLHSDSMIRRRTDLQQAYFKLPREVA
jgi:PIN domain nuclease of toxin-antitoxin system